MNKALWKPSDKLVKNSILFNFLKSLNLKVSKNFKELWKWSVSEPELFWSKFWDFSEIIVDKGKEIIKYNKTFNQTKFFPDSKLNYAENILKKRHQRLR